MFSVEEHAAVQAALDQKLGPDYISQRNGAGGQKVQTKKPKVHIVLAHFSIFLFYLCIVGLH